MQEQGIIILDFGSQYNQLIARRIREKGVYAEILPFHTDVDTIKKHGPKGIILSGGPSSVYGENAPIISKDLFDLGIPVLGICYGMQLTAFLLGGEVEKADKQEFGKAILNIEKDIPLFKDVPKQSQVWMSHGDHVKTAPKDFTVVGNTDNTEVCVMINVNKNIYGVQFHPEVTHSEYGEKIFENFVFEIAKCERSWTMGSYIEKTIADIKQKVGDKKVILGLSGGVDSSVAAVLIHRAIGDNLTCIFVDTGLQRQDEAKQVMETYGEHFHINIKMIDAEKRFLEKLEDVADPEAKRKIIGKEFIEVFQEEANKITDAEFLAQGTIYPDVIESVSIKGPSATIKSHHNVGGLPKDMKFKLLEPLRELFKDEVRRVGRELGIPDNMIDRHPFPGPGLAVRILGAVNKEKADLLRKADAIFIEELRKNNLYKDVSQAGVILLPVKSVGVMGDERTYAFTVALRAVNTIDFMTAVWTHLPYEFLGNVSNRIINEVKGINRVVYDISSKPPATIEWE